ncbi:CCC motif membrane protein [Winogradskyella forsetii]|uniref:CCC motif membrane protein n=1 Tax=Winogradskyella forsetii TaxID=2686077 RepID=UPI0015B8DC43|nr:CCC motif membrane protein [Winogradskyella forsetii]
MNKLPADPLALILGILALVIGIAGCCCYGITAIFPLVMSIIGLVVANKSLREFGENPDAFDPQSRSNVNTAKIINIIAIVINSLVFLVAIAAFAFYGTLISSAILDGIENGNFEEDDYYQSDDYYNSDSESDTINTWEEDDYIIEKESEVEEKDSIDIK